jgi:hypothetical protein
MNSPYFLLLEHLIFCQGVTCLAYIYSPTYAHPQAQRYGTEPARFLLSTKPHRSRPLRLSLLVGIEFYI